MLNPELKKGDRVICYHMEDEWGSVPPGTKGTVKNKVEIFGDTQYEVEWDNGSSLALISSCDAWKLEKPKVNENFGADSIFWKNIDVFTYFKMRFFKNYLLKLRECSVVNMFQAAHYLWMGKSRMEIDFKYHNVDSEICEEVLDLANASQAEMIAGVIKFLEDKGKEDSLENINRYLPRFAQMILENYMYLV
jgi:hypothetical protein